MVAILRLLLIAALGLVSAGCSEELGPVPLRVARVQGVVREGGRPVSGGWIEFFPVDGTVGNLRSARLDKDGQFKAERVAVGTNLVRLVHAPSGSPELSRLFGSYQSPIRRVIAEQPGAPLTVDLVEEAIRFQKARARERGRESSGTRGSR